MLSEKILNCYLFVSIKQTHKQITKYLRVERNRLGKLLEIIALLNVKASKKSSIYLERSLRSLNQGYEIACCFATKAIKWLVVFDAKAIEDCAGCETTKEQPSC